MPTTTNFGWTTPADTDLVKDGAAAIRTLGSNIDTSLVDLKGGTTGQYLQKNSGTDLDYVWADVSAGGMTLISTTNLAGLSTVTLSSIPSTYTNLVIVTRNIVTSTDELNTRFRFNADATANRYINFSGTTWYDGTSSSFGDSDIALKIISKLSTAGTDRNLGVFQLSDYANTVTWKTIVGFVNQTNSNDKTQGKSSQVNGLYNQTSAISSLQFFPSSGNFNSGTILLYGVK